MHIPKILQVNNWLTPSHKDKPSGATSQKRFNKLEPKRDLTQTPVFLTENNLLLMSMLMSICIPHGPLSRAHLYSSLRLIQYLSMHFYLQQQTIWQVDRNILFIHWTSSNCSSFLWTKTKFSKCNLCSCSIIHLKIQSCILFKQFNSKVLKYHAHLLRFPEW